MNQVVRAITSPAFYQSYISLPPPNVPFEIEMSQKFFPYFKDAIGAIDGTHINATPPVKERARYRNRKGGISQNVLAGCTFDMQFCYVLSGWEGSAADGAIYQDARATDFRIPDGKYYLADAGFSSCQNLMVPYRGVRYHLREWTATGAMYEQSFPTDHCINSSFFRPETAQELYNLRHSSLRNAVERIFGILKKRFKIVREFNDYPIEFQTMLVPAVCALHNFIILHDADDQIEINDEEMRVWVEEARPEPGVLQGGISAAETALANTRRDEIAQEMWVDYQKIRANRRRATQRRQVRQDNLQS
jgi:hypothetical protein